MNSARDFPRMGQWEPTSIDNKTSRYTKRGKDNKSKSDNLYWGPWEGSNVEGKPYVDDISQMNIPVGYKAVVNLIPIDSKEDNESSYTKTNHYNYKIVDNWEPLSYNDINSNKDNSIFVDEGADDMKAIKHGLLKNIIITTLIAVGVCSITLFDLISWLLLDQSMFNAMFNISVGLASSGIVISTLLAFKNINKREKCK